MKTLLLSFILMLSMATPIYAQLQYLGKVSPVELKNITDLIKYNNNLPMSTTFTSLPEDRMIELMTAVDKQCKSAYILNEIYAKQPTSELLMQSIKESVVKVPGKRLINYNKALARYNELNRN